MAHFLETLAGDPLLLKELVTRMRARTVLVVELVYIILVCGIVFLGFMFTRGLDMTPGWELGPALFQAIISIQVMLMFFVSPLVAASAVSGEKEQKTFDSLCVTPVSARRIVLTKLAASLSFFFMLILISLPFACASLIMGGVAPSDLLAAYLYTFLATAAAGAMGLYWSTRFERSIASIPAAAVVAVLVIIAGMSLDSTDDFKALVMVSPVMFLQGLFEHAELPWYGGESPFWAPSFILLVIIFLFYVTAACVRMRFPSERRYVLLRCLVLLFFLTTLAWAVGTSAHPAERPAEARDQFADIIRLLLISFAFGAPWIGASVTVMRSEQRNRARGSRAARAVARLLTHPAGFMIVLMLGTAPMVAAALNIGGPLNLPAGAAGLTFFGIFGLSTLAWTLLSLRLADRETTRGRFIGMAIAYVIMAAVIIAPMAMAGFLQTPDPEHGRAWLQYVALLSPLTICEHVTRIFSKSEMASVLHTFGSLGPFFLTAGFYALVSLLLALPIYRRRRARPPAPAA